VGRPAAGGAAGGRRQALGEGDLRAGRCPRSCPSGTPEEIGFPLLVKAAAGRRAARHARRARPRELDEALAAARREAAAAFGDDTVFCERYLERPRHVEIQLLADGHGNVVALGERDCSIQRRHQKVLEESPSPALDPELRERMSDAAVAFARAIGYESAGTAEFLVDGRDFFFLELNARIQVEHPVTELVTGVDLVREQLRIASGEALSDLVTSCHLRGHAVEVRLYAEDPRTFLPQAGRIERLRLPEGVRVDSGVREGDEIGTAYDPMIAKLIAAGDTRDEAFERLAAALRETEVGGVTTNLPFLRWLVGTRSSAPAASRRRSHREPAALGAAAQAHRRPSGAHRGGSTSPLPRPVPRRTSTPPEGRAQRARRSSRPSTRRCRHGDPRARRARRRGRGAPAARRARGDEDGDAARLAVRRDGADRARERGRPGRGRRRTRELDE
jgi:acetyl/propionyl-CoA carboxylase alpha subunit